MCRHSDEDETEESKVKKRRLLDDKLKEYRVLAKKYRPNEDDDWAEENAEGETGQVPEPVPCFLGLFAGSGNFTRAVSRRAAAHQAEELYNEKDEIANESMDLLRPECQKRLCTLIRQGRVRRLHAAPPRHWQTAKANRLASIMARLCRAQARAGGWFSIENPETSLLWKMPCMVSLAQLTGVELMWTNASWGPRGGSRPAG